MNNHNYPLILIIDDEPAILKTLKDVLTDEQYQVETLSDGNKALNLIGKLVPDLILLDIFMPNCNGLELLEKIKKEYPDQKVMMISGYGNIPIALEAIQKGAIDFIEKPLNLDEILQKIEQTKKQSLATTHTNNKASLLEYDIAGQSNLFLELIWQAENLAPHAFPILIYGEHGVGKSTLAQFIHKKSLLRKQPYVTINCETTTQETFQQELAKEKQQTIYLKHVNRLSKELQITLLMVMEKEPQIRIIASCTQSLFKLSEQGKFNNSLFYLLNKAPLEVPPLRKRAYDIPLLLNHYLSHYNLKYKKRAILNSHAIRILRNYKWLGNITELRNIIEKLILTCNAENQVINQDSIYNVIGEKNIGIIEEQSFKRFSSFDEATNAFEKKYLLYLLRKNHYNLDQTCNHIQFSSTQLKNKLIELKIEVPR